MVAERKSPLAQRLKAKATLINELLQQYTILRYGDETFRRGDDTFRRGDRKWKQTKGKEGTAPGKGGIPPGYAGIFPQIMVASSPKSIYYEEEGLPVEESEEDAAEEKTVDAYSPNDQSVATEGNGEMPQETGVRIVNPLAQALVGLGEMTTKEAHKFELDAKYTILTELGVEERYNCNVLLPWARQLAAHITYILETREIYCVVPGQNVLGNTEIQNIAVGSTVLDGEGLISHVSSANSKWYHGDVVEILPQILKIPIKVTPEHNILVLPRTFKRDGISILKLLKRWADGVTRKNKFSPAWVPARNVERGMYVGFPIFQQNLDVKQLDLYAELRQKARLKGEYVYNSANKLGKGLKRFLPLSPELGELCGFYLAEGCHGSRGIRFYFGKTPTELRRAERTAYLLEKTFGLTPQIRDSTTAHATMVLLNSHLLDKLFANWFDNYAYTKRIPLWLLTASDAIVESFIKGAWEGDGHIHRTSNDYTWFGYTTTSQQAALGICALLIRLGIRPNLGMYQVRPKKLIKSKHPEFKITVQSEPHILGRILNVETRQTKSYRTAFFLDNKLWFPIESVRTMPYSGPVHDISLKPNDSFVLGPIIVHNSAEIKAIYPELLGDLEVARSSLDHLAYLLGRQHGLLSNRQFAEMMSKILHYTEVAKQSALQLADHHLEFVTAETSPLEGSPEIEWVMKEMEGAPKLPKRKEEEPKGEPEEEQ